MTADGPGAARAYALLLRLPARCAHPERGRCKRRSPELEARLRAYFGPDITQAHLKMAEAPASAPPPDWQRSGRTRCASTGS